MRVVQSPFQDESKSKLGQQLFQYFTESQQIPAVCFTITTLFIQINLKFGSVNEYTKYISNKITQIWLFSVQVALESFFVSFDWQIAYFRHFINQIPPWMRRITVMEMIVKTGKVNSPVVHVFF